MSCDEIKVLESDLDRIENKTKEIIVYFEDQIVELVDRIENLQKILDEKEKEIDALKDVNKKVEDEKTAFVSAVNHDRLQNIINGIEIAMKNNLANALSTNNDINTSEKKIENQNNQKHNEHNAVDNNHKHNEQNVVDNNQKHNEQNVVDNNQKHRIENSNSSDIIDVDENEDPFSLARDDNWDKEISSENHDVSSTEDSYLEDEYILNEDDTNDFLFDDETK